MMSSNPIQRLQELGQAVWYDNVSRGLIRSGGLQRLIDLGVSGLTSNPTIFEKAITGSDDYDDQFEELSRRGRSAGEIFEAMAIKDIQDVAGLLRPIYERTGGADGFASIEVSPHLAHDTEGTIQEARRLFAALNRPNVMVKVPGTPEGVPTIRALIGEGVNVNVTLLFSRDAYASVRDAYVSGLEDLASNGGDVSKVASVASFFVSRVDTAVDAELDTLIAKGKEELEDLKGTAAIANAVLAYQDFEETFGSGRFDALSQMGAKVQRPLWASTSVKNPAYSDIMYVEELIGENTVNTMPEVTLTAYLERGDPLGHPIKEAVDGAEAMIWMLEGAGISMKQVTDKLLADGVKAFADSFDKLIENIEQKRQSLLAEDGLRPAASLGDYAQDVDAALDDLQQRDIIARIWRKNHTVWKPEPTEITDRLGWLTVTDAMRGQLAALESFAAEIKDEGYRHVVLLGMGGSSLGPEVLRATFGSADGYPELIVLDSTVPAWAQSVTDAIDPAKTMFLVSSKSGTTIEPNTFYRHFRALVDKAVGKEQAGRSFAAVTDPGTKLEQTAREQGFRRVFQNPEDLGGRYSVLSYFGLVPAALIGVDIALLVERADAMRAQCVPEAAARDNPGAWLGAVMGALANLGRDKLTLAASPSVERFGLWVEQLIAESTGKDGKGIVPVAGEPVLGPDAYGDDRLFVYLRVEADDNSRMDAAMERLESAGHPVVRLGLPDKYDLGAEFYRWQMATAVAGAIIGVNPFDQPDVDAAKDLARRAIDDFQKTGRLPDTDAPASLSGLLSQARAGDYLAIMAYIEETPETDSALNELRRKVMERHRIATTLGYGPRFLHSTGQLHKGGANNGLFLQIVAARVKDIPIPGESYTLGVLADSQAIGDLQALRSRGRRVARVQLRAAAS
ncbi:MAG: bifunctional transaldolase/phosoglucose isomerase, partial [Chloroflexi bacterium]|nr:bifunctional transaldolase/phosoglucose isomerase [Chloroflexota bacterium]